MSHHTLVHVGSDCVLCIEAKFFVPVGRWMPRKPPNLHNSFNLECFCKSISNYAESRKWDNFFTLVGDEHFPVIGKGTDLYFTRAARTIKLHTIIRTSKCKIRADLNCVKFVRNNRSYLIYWAIGPMCPAIFQPLISIGRKRTNFNLWRIYPNCTGLNDKS